MPPPPSSGDNDGSGQAVQGSRNDGDPARRCAPLGRGQEGYNKMVVGRGAPPPLCTTLAYGCNSAHRASPLTLAASGTEELCFGACWSDSGIAWTLARRTRGVRAGGGSLVIRVRDWWRGEYMLCFTSPPPPLPWPGMRISMEWLATAPGNSMHRQGSL